jgi:hypothetical protein
MERRAMTPAEALTMAITSLDFTEDRFRSYPNYPSAAMRSERIQEAKDAKQVLRQIRHEISQPEETT